MIRNVNLKTFDKACSLPAYAYWGGVDKYELIAKTRGGYTITLAKLTVGSSMSKGNVLSHAVFESYTDHGEKMSEAKARIGGFESDFMAVKNAMQKVGIEFEPIAPCHFSELLNALGAYYNAVNPDIAEYTVMSQRCH